MDPEFATLLKGFDMEAMDQTRQFGLWPVARPVAGLRESGLVPLCR